MKTFTELAKQKRAEIDELIATFERVRDKLPKEAKDAIDKHTKKKIGKK